MWRVLLTSHPDLDRAGDAMVGELRVANQENQKLERQLAEEQEQKDGLMITVRQRVLSVEGGGWCMDYSERQGETEEEEEGVN